MDFIAFKMITISIRNTLDVVNDVTSTRQSVITRMMLVCPTNLDNSRAKAYCACSRCMLELVGYFFSHLSFSFLSVWKTAKYRPQYSLKKLLNPKQPTNHSRVSISQHEEFSSSTSAKKCTRHTNGWTDLSTSNRSN